MTKFLKYLRHMLAAADDNFEEGRLDDLKQNALKKLKQSKKISI